MDLPAEWLWPARAVTQRGDHKVCLVSSFHLQHCILVRKLDFTKCVLSLLLRHSLQASSITEVTLKLRETQSVQTKFANYTLYDHISHKPRPIFRLEPVDLLKSLALYQEACLLAYSHLALLDAS